jgi:hypothetical protein
MNKGCILARAPAGQMQGAATPCFAKATPGKQAMRCHRRGAATKQMPARRRAPAGLGAAAKCNLYSFTGPKDYCQQQY